ncbi:MAG: SpoIIE family protein phosphatase, partial [Acidobacteriota bacterium]
QTGMILRYQRGELAMGEVYPYGVEVYFSRGAPSGFGFWLDDPNVEELQGTFRQMQLVNFARVALFYFLLPLVAVPFLRRYHDGQLGVRRGTQFFIVSLLMGIVLVALNSPIYSAGTNVGFLSRQQTTWMVGGFSIVFQFLGLAVLGLMSWSVGESLCRERWPQKLASLDALFRRKWSNATVARASLRGVAGGLFMVGLLTALSTLGQDSGAWAVASIIYAAQGFDSVLPSLTTLAFVLSYSLPLYLFVCLLVPCWATKRMGSGGGLAFALLTAVLISPILMVLPLSWGWLMWAVVAGIPVLLFRFGDLLSGLLAALFAVASTVAIPALYIGEPAMQAHGWATLLLLASPLIVSLRSLATDEEFVYTYDDVPPHVRRIAERERQRVEIETARNIQSSILPDLPPQLNGVEIAHSYLPASEVGGDFYDVLALDDGRLAVAVGDVAGHGVSSGLVMSMARSALSVQVTFDPTVEAVFATLNRMVYQSARRRLLSTLVYAILDPNQRELTYASAGHVFPYRVSPDGDVEPLEAASYPLGVRGEIDVRMRTSKLSLGDAVFMYSDGLVEATPEGSEEQFGFDRLEESLQRHASKSPMQLRDAVLADVEHFTRRQIRDDDLTVLVLRLPAA